MLVTARSSPWQYPTTPSPASPSLNPAPAGSGLEPPPVTTSSASPTPGDGGETWTDVALPEQMAATSGELATKLPYGDKLLEIAADGDRVAVTFSWERETARDKLYISDDAGRSWTTPAPSKPGATAHTCTSSPTDGWR